MQKTQDLLLGRKPHPTSEAGQDAEGQAELTRLGEQARQRLRQRSWNGLAKL